MTQRSFHRGWKKTVLLPGVLLIAVPLMAHNINYALSSSPPHEVVWYYLSLGFKHIIPEGFDHILFVAGLCLVSKNLKTIIWQATAFTAAHCITLLLSMKNILAAPGAIVEPIIALSILFIAVENILRKELKPWRFVLVFLFGLVHGMGFASALNEIGLPPGKFVVSILSFNLGVELGQITVILAIFFLIVLPFRNRSDYKKWVTVPLSILIAMVAAFWTIQRLL